MFYDHPDLARGYLDDDVATLTPTATSRPTYWLYHELWRVLTGRGAYAGSAEELTPVKRDGVSTVPLAITAISVLLAPKLAKPLARRGWGAHLLDPAGIRLIERDDFVERS